MLNKSGDKKEDSGPHSPVIDTGMPQDTRLKMNKKDEVVSEDKKVDLEKNKKKGQFIAIGKLESLQDIEPADYETAEKPLNRVSNKAAD